ncbi:MAG: hypothetical protein FJ304_15120 [Planctomycetes bacterium]|nr:hypothetical protein [Planctomycetota bacterium]
MNPNNSAVSNLAVQWWPLALRTASECAKRWRVPYLTDEFQSAAGVAVLAGARAFLEREGDTTRPGPGAFVTKATAWECYRVLQAEKPKRAKYLDAVIDGTEAGTLGAVIACNGNDPTEAAERNEAVELARVLLDRAPLTANELSAAVRHYGQGETCEALAAERGCTRQAVHQAARLALAKLRDVAGVQGATTDLRALNSRTATARRMRAAGAPVREIARALGLSRAAVYSATAKATGS